MQKAINKAVSTPLLSQGSRRQRLSRLCFLFPVSRTIASRPVNFSDRQAMAPEGRIVIPERIDMFIDAIPLFRGLSCGMELARKARTPSFKPATIPPRLTTRAISPTMLGRSNAWWRAAIAKTRSKDFYRQQRAAVPHRLPRPRTRY